MNENELRVLFDKMGRRLARLERAVFPPDERPAAQRRRIEHMLRRIDGRSLQTWYRETGHDNMAQLILSLPEDIVERMRLSAPRSLWQRWIESAEFVGPAPDGGARCVEDALKALRRLEARGEIWVQEDNETFVRPAQIRAAVWKKNRAIVGRRLKAKIQAAAKVKQMKELL